MDTQRQFQKGNTMCALKGTHQKDKKWKDIPGGGETRSKGRSWRKVCKISLRWVNREKKKSGFRTPRNTNIQDLDRGKGTVTNGGSKFSTPSCNEVGSRDWLVEYGRKWYVPV